MLISSILAISSAANALSFRANDLYKGKSPTNGAVTSAKVCNFLSLPSDLFCVALTAPYQIINAIRSDSQIVKYARLGKYCSTRFLLHLIGTLSPKETIAGLNSSHAFYFQKVATQPKFTMNSTEPSISKLLVGKSSSGLMAKAPKSSLNKTD